MSMIARLRGVIEEKGRDHVLVDVQGVGYLASVPGSTLSRLGAVGEQVTLRTFLYVREDTLQLFGFLTPEEQETFERLLGVTGVGPRGALAFLTHFSPAELAGAVERRDAAALTRVKGVGRKTAERLLIELQGRLGPSVDGGLAAAGPGGLPRDDEAAVALLALGYSAGEIAAAIATIPASGALALEQRILLAIRAMDRFAG